MAKLKPKDVDMFHPYDDFLIAVMLKLEQMGFCKRGQGSQFLRDTDIGPKGTLPINTGGGQIGCGQPRARRRSAQPGRGSAPADGRSRPASGEEPAQRGRHRHRRDPLRPKLGHVERHGPAELDNEQTRNRK